MQNKSSLAAAVGWVLAVVLAIVFPAALNSIYWTSVLTGILIYVLLAVSLRNIYLVGEFSLGHGGFMCLGAYTSALLALKASLPFALTLPAGGLLAGLVGLALGYPFMRVKGVYFVILTVVTSESFRLLAFNWKGLTGGTDGLIGFPGAGALSIPGIGVVDFGGFIEYYYLTLAVVCVSLYILYRLERSRLGFIWLAIRETDKMSAAVGINVLRYKVINFSVACFFAGIGGALLAHSEQALSPMASASFGVMTTIYLLVFMVVGGKTRFEGPIVGAVVLSLVSEFTRPVEEYQPMIIGAIAITVAMLLPNGLASIPGLFGRWRFSPPGASSKTDAQPET
ncbi:MAG: branched-chain amino acid ABC transporter permease [Planctomycetota bacterium]|jgi:branched-chain amino acid transport system permease protein